MTESVIILGGYDGPRTPVPVTGGGSGGSVQVEGMAADGAPVSGNPVLMGGSDGTNAQTFITDSSGRQIIIGASADGAAATGNPVLVAGRDGVTGLTHIMLTDSVGHPIVSVTSLLGWSGPGVNQQLMSASFPVVVANNQTYDLPTVGRTQALAINFAASGDNTVVAAVAAQSIRVYRIFFVVAGTTNITIKSSAGTNFTGAMPFVANGSLVLDFASDPGNEPHFIVAAGQAFVINSSNAVQVSGRIQYGQS